MQLNIVLSIFIDEVGWVGMGHKHDFTADIVDNTLKLFTCKHSYKEAQNSSFSVYS